MKIKIYFAHALSNAPKKFLARMKRIKKLFRKLHPECEILDFYGLGPAPTDGDIIRYDLRNVRGCHLMVGICDCASNGLGSETSERLRKARRPLLLLAPEIWKAKTRMVTGWPDLYPKLVIFRRYKNDKDIIRLVEEALTHFGIK